MADHSEQNIDQLTAELNSKDPVQRQAARAALVELGSTALPALTKALAAPQSIVRWEAAKSLVEIADPAAAEELVMALGDEDSDVVWAAGEALVALRRDALNPLLRKLIQGNHPQGLYEGAHHVLHELAKRDSLVAIVQPVVQALNQQQPEISVPAAATEALKSV